MEAFIIPRKGNEEFGEISLSRSTALMTLEKPHPFYVEVFISARLMVLISKM